MSAVPVSATSGVTLLRTEAIDASPPPGGRERRPVRLSSSQLLIGISLLLTWFLLYTMLLSGFEQSHAQSSLYTQLRTELAEGTAPTGAPIATGAPVALLSIPGAGVDDLVVVEGSRPTQLQDGPGHVLGSVLPGQRGISVIAGRSLSFGGPFGQIAGLAPGAPITVTTGQGTFVYQVLDVRVKGDPVPAAPTDKESRLTLVTSGGGSGLGALQPSQTVYVDATLAQGAVVGGPRSVPDPDSHLMSNSVDTTTLALLALSLQLLVGALAGFVWAWNRWSHSAAWMAGIPCVLAALWLVSSIGSRLLPGLI